MLIETFIFDDLESMGHTVDVNENVYKKVSLERRREAVNKLDSALIN